MQRGKNLKSIGTKWQPTRQCDQFRLFFKGLDDQISYESSPNIWQLLREKTAVATFRKLNKKLGFFLF